MNTRTTFFILVCSTCVIHFLSKMLLFSDDLYFNSFAEQLTYEQIENIINEGKKWKWLSYTFIPILTFVKLTLVASCLSVSLFFIANKFSFKAAFRVALEVEFVFLVPPLLKILWFALFQTDYTLQELQVFYPLSTLNFFDYTTLQPWLIYPRQLFNVFEIIYWVLLARGVSQIIERDMGKSLEVVATSYGTGLLLWVAVVMFITVSFTP